MVTLVCEIINKELEYKGFYNPSVDGYKKCCRNMGNLQKNLDNLISKVNKDGILCGKKNQKNSMITTESINRKIW